MLKMSFVNFLINLKLYLVFTYLMLITQLKEEISIFLNIQTIHFPFIFYIITKQKFIIQLINHKNFRILHWIKRIYFVICKKFLLTIMVKFMLTLQNFMKEIKRNIVFGQKSKVAKHILIIKNMMVLLMDAKNVFMRFI